VDAAEIGRAHSRGALAGDIHGRVTIEGEAMQKKLAATMLAGTIAVTAAAALAQAPKPATNGKVRRAGEHDVR
jgi:hypothetical protein